jgi:hypothetical protein
MYSSSSLFSKSFYGTFWRIEKPVGCIALMNLKTLCPCYLIQKIQIGQIMISFSTNSQPTVETASEEVRSSTPTGSWEGTGLKTVGNVNLPQKVSYVGRGKEPPKKKAF